jgi:diguanylate cyclase (GGDEF)-like protein
LLLSIKSKIFISHLFLIIILLLGLSYKHYINSLDNYTNNLINFYKNSSTSIISTASLAISGKNYGNIQLPSFIKELTINEKLLYLKISGISDYSSKKFSAVYDKKHQSLYRNIYPIDFKNRIEKKLKRFTSKLNDPLADKVKLNFLIQRAKDALNQYNTNINLSKEANNNYSSKISNNSHLLDFQSNLLYLTLETNNKNSGMVSMVFDISEINDIKYQIIKNLIIESLIALIISILVLNILSKKIIDPLNKLSIFMEQDFKNIDTSQTPAINSNDEIGILSKRFKVLLEKVQKLYKETEKKAYIDALTGVNNRNKFNEIFEKELKRSERYKTQLSVTIIDIDKFKNFNDTYGHLIGDEVLTMMAQNVNENVRDTDIFARWGGEEFVLLFIDTSADDAVIACSKLKDGIQRLNHPIAGRITASFGVTHYIQEDNLKSMLKRCDDALYVAKSKGRNRVELV